jgi:hypothetical protein
MVAAGRPIEIVQGRDAVRSAVGKFLENPDDAVRVGIWQATEQDAMHKAEHGRVRANRERDSGNRDSSRIQGFEDSTIRGFNDSRMSDSRLVISDQ